jgi:hypothetical protein
VRLRRRLTAGLAVLAAILVAACTAAPPQLAPSQVLSSYERDTGNSVRRDCGYSSPLPGKPGWSLWLFCDTVIASVRGGKTERLILGTDTAAAGPYRAGYAPARLSEIPTPPTPLSLPGAGAPEPFLPGPQRVSLPDSTLPCAGPGAYPASWISGVAREPSADAAAHLLISYDNYCVTGNANALTAEGFGLIEYDPARNRHRDFLGCRLPGLCILITPRDEAGVIPGHRCSGLMAATCLGAIEMLRAQVGALLE